MMRGAQLGHVTLCGRSVTPTYLKGKRVSGEIFIIVSENFIVGMKE